MPTKKHSKEMQELLDILFNLAGSGLLEETPYQDKAEVLLRKHGEPV